MRGLRWITAGIADQLVIACANAGNTVLALVLLDRSRAAIMFLALGVAYLVIGINRAFVGDVLLTLVPRYEPEDRTGLVRNGLAAALIVGAAAAVVMVGFWLAWPTGGNIDLRDLGWAALFVPLALVHDTGRCAYLADREPAKALVIDLVWVGTQAVGVVVMLLAGRTSAPGLFICWGVGAAAGAAVFLLRTRHRPWRGDPRGWIHETRYLSGWFTATALVGQFQVQAVAFIVSGQLSQPALSGLRAAQMALIQPIQNFMMAVQGLVVPRASRLARDAARRPRDERAAAASAALRRQTRLLALGFTGLAVVLVAFLWPLAELVLTAIPKFADIAPLALPMSLQGGIYLVQLPFLLALRGMHWARALFVQYVVFTTVSLTALVVGAMLDGLPGAAWGLTVGAVAGFVCTLVLYFAALRRLDEAGTAADTSALPPPTDDALAPI